MNTSTNSNEVNVEEEQSLDDDIQQLQDGYRSEIDEDFDQDIEDYFDIPQQVGS